MDESSPGIEIRDPALDGDSLIRRVAHQVAQRRAEGRYDPDLTTRGPASLQPDRPAPAEPPVTTDFPGLSESLAELIGRSRLHEPGFASNVPLVGPLIAAVRRAWNWMSTKWYVLPILGQQSDVNIRTVRLISDLAQWHELDARRLRQLEARVADLEARLGVEKRP